MAVRVPGSALQPVHAWVVCGAIPAKEIDRLRSAIRLTRGEFSSRRRIGQSATVSTRLTIVSFFSSFLGALCSVAQCAIGKEICMLHVVRMAGSRKKRLFLDCQIRTRFDQLCKKVMHVYCCIYKESRTQLHVTTGEYCSVLWIPLRKCRFFVAKCLIEVIWIKKQKELRTYDLICEMLWYQSLLRYIVEKRVSVLWPQFSE